VETEISGKMGDAREKARGIIQTTIEDAKRQAELTRQEKLKQADREKDELLTSNTNAIDALVDDICKIILSTGYNRDGE
jgi:vacuolar-type H+-ATPase subunit H